MKKKYWILLFAVVLSGDLLGIQLQEKGLQFIFKPLVIPVLTVLFASRVAGITGGISRWIFAALLFSLAGDILLLFEAANSVFFLLGLSAFLLAHIFYIIFFQTVRLREQVKMKPLWLIGVFIYYAALVSLLFPGLGDMKIPVLVYGIVISLMFMLAVHMLFIKNKTAGVWMMTGALLFVLSDSVLAVNKFYASFDGAGILIMLTYGLAQFFLTAGAARYIRSGISG